MRGRSSAGERLLCKQGVVGSNPIASIGWRKDPRGHGPGGASGKPHSGASGAGVIRVLSQVNLMVISSVLAG